MKKNGKTSAGRTRWRRKDPGRGSPLSRGYDRRAADPETLFMFNGFKTG